jgi:hypothetical protein
MLLVGCAQVGLQPAQSFDQQLAYGYAGVTSARISATNALKAGSIKKEDAQQVLDLTDQARALLDGARAIRVSDLKTAQAKLALATQVLTQLSAYLTTRGLK